MAGPCHLIDLITSFQPDILASHYFKVSGSDTNQVVLEIKTQICDYNLAALTSENITFISKPSKSVNKCDESSNLYHRIIKSGVQ